MPAFLENVGYSAVAGWRCVVRHKHHHWTGESLRWQDLTLPRLMRAFDGAVQCIIIAQCWHGRVGPDPVRVLFNSLCFRVMQEERTRLMRMTIVRYMNLACVQTMSLFVPSLQRRFVTWKDFVQAGRVYLCIVHDRLMPSVLVLANERKSRF